MDKSIFTRIIQKELPADIVFENERIIVFKDIYPAAPVHLLLCPKKEIIGMQAVAAEDWPVIIELLQIAQKLAEQFQIAEGYRLLTNNGSLAGQQVFHLHFHLIGGKRLGHIG